LSTSRVLASLFVFASGLWTNVRSRRTTRAVAAAGGGGGGGGGRFPAACASSSTETAQQSPPRHLRHARSVVVDERLGRRAAARKWTAVKKTRLQAFRRPAKSPGHLDGHRLLRGKPPGGGATVQRVHVAPRTPTAAGPRHAVRAPSAVCTGAFSSGGDSVHRERPTRCAGRRDQWALAGLFGNMIMVVGERPLAEHVDADVGPRLQGRDRSRGQRWGAPPPRSGPREPFVRARDGR